jgi:outer membrane protein assembly factor BamB
MKAVEGIILLAIVGLSGCRDPFGGSGVGGDPKVLWRVPSSGAAGDETPHEPAANADRTMVYFVTTDYRLKKVRAADGIVVWDVDAGPAFGTPPNWNVVLSGGNAIMEKVDLFAYDTTTGEPRWSYTGPGGDQTGYTALVSDDSTVFAASQGGRAYAIDARTGTARWITDLRQGQTNVGALFPVLANGLLYVCTHNTGTDLRGTLWALDAGNGSVRWSYTFQPELPQQYSICRGDPAIWQDVVIEPQSDGRVFAFDTATGAVRWVAPRVHQLPSQTGPFGSWTGSWTDTRWAAAYGDNLIVTSKVTPGMVVSLDPATGAERWRSTAIFGAHLSHPALDASTLYLSYGWFYVAFDLATGRIKWRTPKSDYDPATMLQGKPVIAQDRIFVGGRDGSYAVAK